MTFDEWYDSKESTKMIPPELQDFWREGVKMVWDAAVEATKKACAEAMCNSCPGGDGPCFEKPPGCEIYKTIIKSEVK